MVKISSISMPGCFLQAGRMDDAEEFLGASEEKLLSVQNGFLEIVSHSRALWSSLLVGTLPSPVAVMPSGRIWAALVNHGCCFAAGILNTHLSVPSIAKGFLKLITGLAQVIV